MRLYLENFQQSWLRKVTIFFPAQIRWSWKECSVLRTSPTEQYAWPMKHGNLHLCLCLSCFLWCLVFSNRGVLLDRANIYGSISWPKICASRLNKGCCWQLTPKSWSKRHVRRNFRLLALNESDNYMCLRLERLLEAWLRENPLLLFQPQRASPINNILFNRGRRRIQYA